MAAPEALSVPSEGTATTADPMAMPEATVVPRPDAASQRLPQLIPIAQLVAVVLGVLAIIWNQQQTTDSLRNELRNEISQLETGLRNEISQLETGLRNEISQLETGLRNEISELRIEVFENGQRLARIEGLLEIGAPDALPE